MSEKSRGPRLFVQAAATYLGHPIPDKPRRGDKSAAAKEVRRIRLRKIKTFHQAIVEGRAPPADGHEGRNLWWYQASLDAWIGRNSKPKRGRKSLSEVADAGAA